MSMIFVKRHMKRQPEYLTKSFWSAFHELFDDTAKGFVYKKNKLLTTQVCYKIKLSRESSSIAYCLSIRITMIR